MTALLENNLRLALIAKHDSELDEEKEKMVHFIVDKSIDLLKNKGLSTDEAGAFLALVATSIALQDIIKG